MSRIAFSGMLAVTTGLEGVPATLNVLMSAGPSSKARSDGLMGAASTRSKTSSGAGSGVLTRTSESSSVPSSFSSDRSCSPVLAVSAVMIVSLGWGDEGSLICPMRRWPDGAA